MKIAKIFITLLITIAAIALPTADKALAMTQGDLNNQVYIVSYLNSNALRTAYQYVFFTPSGKVTAVTVEDVDANGQPVVDDDATADEKQAPAKINQLLTHRAYLNKKAKSGLVKINSKDKIELSLNGLKNKPYGKIKKGGSTKDFVVEYLDGKQKYTSVHFKRAPAKYQYR